MSFFPEPPEVPAVQRGAGQTELRYEDVSQDGRLMLLGLPHAIGDLVWRKLLVHHPVTRAGHAGILPILTRFIVEGGGGPVSVRWPLEGDGRYQLAHAANPDGSVKHLMLNMWCSMTGPAGRTYGPPPANAGQQIFVGRVMAEHVFTKLFAPPAERKIVRFDIDGLPAVPPDRHAWRPPETVLELPPGARPLDELFIPDAAPVVFGLNHTDSNRHVNSLVYPRFFQDAALRRFAAHGLDPNVLARRLEIAYRKPCFAGQRVRILLRAFQLGDELGAAGMVVPEDTDKPFCTVNMTFAR